MNSEMNSAPGLLTAWQNLYGRENEFSPEFIQHLMLGCVLQYTLSHGALASWHGVHLLPRHIVRCFFWDLAFGKCKPQ
jgi:hypothetical protein